MNIGDNLRILRLQKQITQEQLAETLGVSPQAISRWENGNTYPDISLLPILANYFDTTTDHLLGMDKIRSEEKIREIFNYALTAEANGNLDEKIRILRDAVKLYPQNDSLRAELALALSKTGKRKEQEEAIRLSETVLAHSTNEKLRSTVRANLYMLYHTVGNHEQALSAGKTLPHIWECREVLLPDLVDEADRNRAIHRTCNIVIQVLLDVFRKNKIPFALGYAESQSTEIKEKTEKLIQLLRQ